MGWEFQRFKVHMFGDYWNKFFTMEEITKYPDRQECNSNTL